VTCATVGYGDIVPVSGYELFWGLSIIVLGVALFSFVLGDLASQFSQLMENSKETEQRRRLIADLAEEYSMSVPLVNKLT
jgi:hypothetical protein